ncbi:MAG TPA: ketoacyl-ACP synthase III, partial [Thermoanaerobaculia bacterium]|nr:ketoacyl-ACP synthase III [Thermoanaerobaculia bacterium]
MEATRRSVIVGSGSYLPERRVANEHFAAHVFCDLEGRPLPQTTEETIAKFVAITGIAERRWVGDDLVASDIGALAAEEALASSGVDRESL